MRVLDSRGLAEMRVELDAVDPTSHPHAGLESVPWTSTELFNSLIVSRWSPGGSTPSRLNESGMRITHRLRLRYTLSP